MGGTFNGDSLIADLRFLDHETGAHPETPLRLDAIQRALEGDEELWGGLTFPECRPASEDAIARCHSRELIDDIREAADSGIRRLDADTVISRASFEVARLAAGAATMAVDLVFGHADNEAEAVDNVFAAVRLPAITPVPKWPGFLFVQQRRHRRSARTICHGAERVLIIDWDVIMETAPRKSFTAILRFSTFRPINTRTIPVPGRGPKPGMVPGPVPFSMCRSRPGRRRRAIERSFGMLSP